MATEAYLVGGCVRDLLLQREPADFDVSTDARPERVHELFPQSLDVGAKFGVTLIVENDVHVEDRDVSLRHRPFRRPPSRSRHLL